MCEVVCPYKSRCSSYPHRCGSCKHNGGKKDYYEPDYTPWIPWYPYYPPVIWTTTGTNVVIDNYYITS